MEILTAKEVSELFKLPLSAVNYFVQTGQIPFSRLGKRNVRFDRQEVQQWFESRKYKRANYNRRSNIKQVRDSRGKYVKAV